MKVKLTVFVVLLLALAAVVFAAEPAASMDGVQGETSAGINWDMWLPVVAIGVTAILGFKVSQKIIKLLTGVQDAISAITRAVGDGKVTADELKEIKAELGKVSEGVKGVFGKNKESPQV